MKALTALFLLAPTSAFAQFWRPALPDPQGVYLDPQGALRMNGNPDPRLAEIRKKAARIEKDKDLCYISLPRILAEAKKHADAGQPLPDRIRYLGGMVKLQYIFVYPEEGDIVIAGRAEPFDTKNPYRPIGLVSGRPVLQLDDLVTALRAAGPGKGPDRVGCDIEVTKEIAERVRAKTREITPNVQTMGFRKAADAIAEAGGSMPVVYFGVDQNTRFAFVCVEADYQLKQLSLGLIKAAKVKSYNVLLPKPERAHRFSLETSYEAIAASPENDAFELRGPSLKVCTGLLARLEGAGEPSDSARQFMTQCNEGFEELCRELLAWTDLANLGDLTVLAALVAKEELDKKAKWDISWIMDPKGYPVPPFTPIKSAARLCSYNQAGNMIIFTSGGIWLNPVIATQKTTRDDKLREKRRRPIADLIFTPPFK